jgi:hypothetical protein
VWKVNLAGVLPHGRGWEDDEWMRDCGTPARASRALAGMTLENDWRARATIGSEPGDRRPRNVIWLPWDGMKQNTTGHMRDDGRFRARLVRFCLGVTAQCLPSQRASRMFVFCARVLRVGARSWALAREHGAILMRESSIAMPGRVSVVLSAVLGRPCASDIHTWGGQRERVVRHSCRCCAHVVWNCSETEFIITVGEAVF